MPPKIDLPRFRQLIARHVGDVASALSRAPKEDHQFAQEWSRKMRIWCGIIDAMTPTERDNPSLVLEDPRRSRVAQGAGVCVTEVNECVKSFLRSADAFQALFTSLRHSPRMDKRLGLFYGVVLRYAFVTSRRNVSLVRARDHSRSYVAVAIAQQRAGRTVRHLAETP